jgi:hypothetical protein
MSEVNRKDCYECDTPTRGPHALIRITKYQGKRQTSKPLVEDVIDRSPTKPERKYSPRRIREEEKVNRFLEATTARKTELKLRDDNNPSMLNLPVYQDNAPRLPFRPSREILESNSTSLASHGSTAHATRLNPLELSDGIPIFHSYCNNSSQWSLRSRPEGCHSSSSTINSRDNTSASGLLFPQTTPRHDSSTSFSIESLSAATSSHHSLCGRTDSTFSATTRSIAPGPDRPSKAKVCMVVQVAPGVTAPLRGSRETWKAIQDDFYMPGMCLVCDVTLFVIQDAGYVLCPDCRTVSPMEGDFIDRVSAGVGLGFKYDDLMRWQREILEKRKQKFSSNTI